MGSKVGFPINQQLNLAQEVGARTPVTVSRGLARLLTFPKNILSVGFADGEVIDVRAINPRTVAVMGKSLGNSNLVVFVQQNPADKVGAARRFAVTVNEPVQRELERARVGQSSRPLNMAKVAAVLGRSWPDGEKSFEDMLVEEIMKRDARIKELEAQVSEK